MNSYVVKLRRTVEQEFVVSIMAKDADAAVDKAIMDAPGPAADWEILEVQDITGCTDTGPVLKLSL